MRVMVGLLGWCRQEILESIHICSSMVVVCPTEHAESYAATMPRMQAAVESRAITIVSYRYVRVSGFLSYFDMPEPLTSHQNRTG